MIFKSNHSNIFLSYIILRLLQLGNMDTILYHNLDNSIILYIITRVKTYLERTLCIKVR